MAPEQLGIAESISNLRESRFFKYLLGVPLILGIGLILTDYIIALSLLISSMTLSYLVHKTGTKRFGIELFTFSMVLISISFGGIIGALTGLFLLIFHVAMVQLKGSYLMWVIPSYPIAGFFVPLLGGFNVFMTGMIVILVLQAFFMTMTLLLSPSKALPAYLPYAATNILFNFLLFKFLAPVLVGMM